MVKLLYQHLTRIPLSLCNVTDLNTTSQPGYCARLQVWILLANYHGVVMEEYVQMLWLHVLWHQKFGVTRYFLHVSERLDEFLSKPGVQVHHS